MSLRLEFVVMGSPNEPPSASAYALVVMAACSRLITMNARLVGFQTFVRPLITTTSRPLLAHHPS